MIFLVIAKYVPCACLSVLSRVQYLVFEYVPKTLLEVLESRRGGMEPEEVSHMTAATCCLYPAAKLQM